MPIHEAHLFYRDARSDKEYHLELVTGHTNGFKVIAKFGPRGGTMTVVDKTRDRLVSYVEALSLFNKTVREKTAKGYTSHDAKAELIARMKKQTGLIVMTDYAWAKLAQFVLDYMEENA
jgi:hypothetical protein